MTLETPIAVEGPRPTAGALPNLLYLSDVPVESSYHGSALLYRLLSEYPSDKLLIVEPDLLPSRRERRLGGVTYARLKTGWGRLLHTRFANFYGSWVLSNAHRLTGKLAGTLGPFAPEALLTVGHGYSCLGAAEFARQHRLPLHVICHDEWRSTVRALGGIRTFAETKFKQAYQRATSRFCVSPGMAEEYLNRYHANAEVLYPSRGKDCKRATKPAPRVSREIDNGVFAFAGTLGPAAYADALRTLALVLGRHGCRLKIFGPITQQELTARGLALNNVELCGLIPSSDLIERLRDEADFLFVPMSFEEKDAANMRLSFPSKLTDYTAVGIPLLIWGPPYCSAVRWASENPDVAAVVDDQAASSLEKAVNRLLRDAQYRVRLAQTAIDCGEQYFSHSAQWKIFADRIVTQTVPRAVNIVK